jgi:hypothetical protein
VAIHFHTDYNTTTMDVPQALQDAIKSEVPKAEYPFAIFDFDNTCIVNDIGEATFAYLCRNNLLKDFSLLSDETDHESYHERVFQTYQNLYELGDIKNAYALNAQMFSGFTPKGAYPHTT